LVIRRIGQILPKYVWKIYRKEKNEEEEEEDDDMLADGKS